MLLRESPERLKTEFRYVARSESQRDPPRRQDGNGRVFRSRRRAGHPGPGRLELLRLLGAVVEIGSRATCEIATASLRSQIAGCAAIRACSRGSMAATSRRPPPSSAPTSTCSRISTGRIPFSRPHRKTSRRSPAATGVKMSGPYDYVPPDYWLADTSKFGGAYGFTTEIGTGAAIPPSEQPRRKCCPPITSCPAIPSGTITRAPSASRISSISKTR